ncbi:MAG: carbonic anhydrase family protein [Terracidiphilus sp.]
MRFSALAVAVLGIATLAAAQQTAYWDYEGKTGPLGWGKLDPAYKTCSQGREQSPIDIRGAHLNEALTPIEFHYIAGTVKLVNNGHTVEVQVKPGSYILAGGVRYDLVQFHFHHPSEEAVKGKLSDMVIHLVHKSADGKLAVVAVRLNQDPGFPNAQLATLWEQLPLKSGDTTTTTEMVNPGGLLPADRGYWTYMGSLTVPPCTEGVRWFVFEQELSISRDQLRRFAALFRMNSRPLQDPHGRRIEANE